jgi:cation diffusion facilitator family transporter
MRSAVRLRSSAWLRAKSVAASKTVGHAVSGVRLLILRSETNATVGDTPRLPAIHASPPPNRERTMDFNSLADDAEDTEHTPAERAAAASRSTWVSVAVNVVLATTQIVIGIGSRSQGLVADGIHSLSDLVADFVVLFASHHARKDADEGHPYGHQRFETAASLVLGALLLAVGVGMLWSAARKLEAREATQAVHVTALYVALAALVAKELLFRYMLAVAKQVKSSMLVANAWHARSDAASSLVVGVGIVGNLAGYPILDPIAALIVGFMVAKMGWEFGWDALHDLMDRAVDDQEVEAIRRTLGETPGVRNVHDLRTRKMGDMIVVDAHLEVDASISVEAGHDIAVQARLRVLQRHRVLNLMTHVDPWHRPDLDHALGLVNASAGP